MKPLSVNVNPPNLVEYVRLPDVGQLPGNGNKDRYNYAGEKDDQGAVIVYQMGVVFVWVRFQQVVKAGQTASMVIGNVPGPWQLGACATEWNTVNDVPHIGAGVVSLIAISHGIGTGGVTCRNDYDADMGAAIGLILILP
jgi:hypothetical protein